MMTEGLINRVKRLVSGGVNSMVDAVESAAPETVMKEAIREIDSAIDEVRDELGLAIANKHHASKRLMEANAKHEDLAEKLRLAVDQGRDDLAEAAISPSDRPRGANPHSRRRVEKRLGGRGRAGILHLGSGRTPARNGGGPSDFSRIACA